MLRELFPALKKVAYLNAAAASPLATPVADAAVAHLRETELDGDVGFPRWLEFKLTLHARFARFIGTRASQVAFTPSTSMGFNLVAELYKRRGIREVLTLEGEFPSTTIPFLNAGLTLNVVKPRADGSYAVEDVERALRPETQAVALSAVQYASGAAIDLTALTALCRSRKLPLALNVAQALGQIRIDAEALGVDFLCGTSHKWMMGGFGVGVFYARQGWLEELGLPWAGWFSPPDPLRWQNFPGSTWDGGRAHGLSTSREVSALEAGGGHWPALFSFGAALGLFEQVGIDAVAAHNRQLQELLRAGLQQRGFTPNAPLQSGICVVPVKGNPLDAVRALLRENVVVTPRGVGIRFSTHLFNDESDIARALAAIDRLGLTAG